MACCPKDAGPGETLVKFVAGLLLVVPLLVVAIVALPFVPVFLLLGGRINVSRALAWPGRMGRAVGESVTRFRCQLSGRLYDVSPRLAGLAYRHFLLVGFALAGLVVLGTTRLVSHLVAGGP